MPRTQRPVTWLTGAIVAALYVILIVGAGQETCMHRRVSADPLPVRALDEFVHLPLCARPGRASARPRPGKPLAPARGGTGSASAPTL